MGVTSYIERFKNWTVYQMGGKSKELDQQGQLQPVQRRFPNLGQDIQQVVHTPEFEHVLNAASPFLLAGLGAWPGYWLYRGFDYHSHRAHVPLPVYIRQTFYQAKLLQFLIIMAGVVHIVKEQQKIEILPAFRNQS